MESRPGSRRQFIKWLNIILVLVPIALICKGISIWVFFVNFKPGHDIVMYHDVIMSLTLLHVFGLLLPMTLVVIGITVAPPYEPRDVTETARLAYRIICVGLLVVTMAVLTAFAFTCETQRTSGPGFGSLLPIGMGIEPFIWISLALAINRFRTCCEGRGKSTIGIAAALTLGCGCTLLVSLALQMTGQEALIGLMLPSIAGILLALGLVLLVVGIRDAKLEISGYIYG